MWELDYKESWAPKNWCFWTVVLEKTLESPLDCKEIKPVNPEGNQTWLFIGRTDAETETPILWPPDAKNWLTGKDPDAGKDWKHKEKGTTEAEMAGWHHRLEQAPGVGNGQGSLTCCSPWGQRVGQDWVTEQQQNKVQVYYILAVLCPSFPNVHCIETTVSYSCLLLLLLFLVDVKSGHHGSILTRNRSWFNKIVGEFCSLRLKSVIMDSLVLELVSFCYKSQIENILGFVGHTICKLQLLSSAMIMWKQT